MHRRMAGFTLAMGVLLLSSPAGAAQQPRAECANGWMLEISHSPGRTPGYEPISADGHNASAAFYDLDWKPGWNHADKIHPQPSAVEFIYRMESGALQVRVLLLFRLPNSGAKEPVKTPVGSYIVRANQSVVIHHLSRFGLKPLTLELVSARPPGVALPTVVNKTHSLAIKKVDEDRNEYKLFVRNTSCIAVEAVAVAVWEKNGHCNLRIPSAPSGGLIPPGGTTELHLGFELDTPEGRLGPGGESCSPAPPDSNTPARNAPLNAARKPEIVIEAADFTNGAYQGDERKAAMLEAARLGREEARHSISALVARQLGNTSLDDTAKIALLRSQVASICKTPAPALAQSIMARFATLRESDADSIRQDVQYGMQGQKAIFLGSLRLFDVERSRGWAPGDSLEKWWAATKGQGDWPLTRK